MEESGSGRNTACAIGSFAGPMQVWGSFRSALACRGGPEGCPGGWLAEPAGTLAQSSAASATNVNLLPKQCSEAVEVKGLRPGVRRCSHCGRATAAAQEDHVLQVLQQAHKCISQIESQPWSQQGIGQEALSQALATRNQALGELVAAVELLAQLLHSANLTLGHIAHTAATYYTATAEQAAVSGPLLAISLSVLSHHYQQTSPQHAFEQLAYAGALGRNGAASCLARAAQQVIHLHFANDGC